MTPSVIVSLRDLVKAGWPLLIVLYMRVSTPEQRKGTNLARRMDRLKRRLRTYGLVKWAGEFTEVRSGKQLLDRPGLRAAIDLARKLQRENPGGKAVVVTDTRNRLLRGEDYDKLASTDEPKPHQWVELEGVARGVVLATVLRPDAPFKHVRRFESRLRPPGRPRKKVEAKPAPMSKKQQREASLPKALRWWMRGLSKRRIARRLGRAESTVRSWLPRGCAVSEPP